MAFTSCQWATKAKMWQQNCCSSSWWGMTGVKSFHTFLQTPRKTTGRREKEDTSEGQKRQRGLAEISPLTSLKSVKLNSCMSFNYWFRVKRVSTGWQEGGQGQGLWIEETPCELPETISSQQQTLTVLGLLPSESKQNSSITWGNLSMSPCLKTSTGGTNALGHFEFY